jgi:transcriptional regulator with XRE-family HTH domain
MPQWQALPESLDERVRGLVVQLRRLKDHSGLSMSSLQAKTSYSRSSWTRYLNGRALPPPQAVRELARAGGVDPTRLLALREVAEEAWQAGATPTDAGDTPPRRGTRRALMIGVLVTLIVGGVIAGLSVDAPWRSGSPATSSKGAFAYRAGKTYSCVVRRREGLLYAGYSTTRTALLSGPGWDVVEAQCLLRYKGFDPGGVDGVYGPNTTRAVKRLQNGAGLPPDGLVGPNTWQVLRK